MNQISGPQPQATRLFAYRLRLHDRDHRRHLKIDHQRNPPVHLENIAVFLPGRIFSPMGMYF